MRRLTWLLVALIVLLQYPLWLGKGGWLSVWKTSRQLDAQRETNQQLENRNAALDAEVRDLKSGLDAIEEHARFELGFIKPGEIFAQTPMTPAASPVSSDNQAAPHDAGKPVASAQSLAKPAATMSTAGPPSATARRAPCARPPCSAVGSSAPTFQPAR